MLFVQAAARSTGPAGACFALVQAQAVELLLSQPVLDEWRDVLSRSEVQRLFPGVTSRQIQMSLTELARSTRMIEPSTAPFVIDRDPKDQKYLDLAFAGRASYLVTRDRDLLAVTSDPLWGSCEANFQILGPVESLRTVAQEP